MKISILTPDISHNCLSRAYLLAQLLSKKYKVEILGPRFGDNIWYPLRDARDITIKSVKGDRKTGRFNLRLLLKMIDGDIIYACKPYPSSFGLGLIAKFLKRKPLILDIDDYEPGWGMERYNSWSIWRKLREFVPLLNNPASYPWMLITHKLIFLADAATVSSKKLQEAYGGALITHARDTDILKPIEYNNSKPIIGFLGTIRPHKGALDLVKALVLLKHKNFLCVITGSGDAESILQLEKLIKTTNMEQKIQFVPYFSFKLLQQALSSVDIVVIPQRKSYVSHYQVPAKLIDSMAMGKVIIATDVGDIRDILSGCGVIIPPNDLFSLTIMLNGCIDKIKEMKALFGDKARERCVKEFDMKVVRRKLNKVIKELI